MSQMPAENTTSSPLVRSHRDAPKPPRLCILCGGQLRSGQRMIRVHGTTIHARCSSIRLDGPTSDGAAGTRT